MKKLNELGISPAPWRFRCETEEYPSVWCAANYHVATQKYLIDCDREVPDARIIAAAPEMYEALCEAVEQMCKHCNCRNHWCLTNPCDYIKRWKRALAKAAGEEETK